MISDFSSPSGAGAAVASTAEAASCFVPSEDLARSDYFTNGALPLQARWRW
jgi:hypothetical protein